MSIDLTTWTLAQIRSKVRDLTGQLGTANYDDTKLDRFINNFYQYVLPRKAKILELTTRFTLPIDDDGNDGRYPIAPEIIQIETPVLIDGDPISLYFDHTSFWGKWPRSQTHEKTTPSDVLLFDRELWFRAPPDQAYTVEVVAEKMPAKLVNTDDQPVSSRLGPAIAYGAAIDILTDQGDMEAAAEKVLNLKTHLGLIGVDWKKQFAAIAQTKPSF